MKQSCSRRHKTKWRSRCLRASCVFWVLRIPAFHTHQPQLPAPERARQMSAETIHCDQFMCVSISPSFSLPGTRLTKQRVCREFYSFPYPSVFPFRESTCEEIWSEVEGRGVWKCMSLRAGTESVEKTDIHSNFLLVLQPLSIHWSEATPSKHCFVCGWKLLS